jgi:hypothetical protein
MMIKTANLYLKSVWIDSDLTLLFEDDSTRWASKGDDSSKRKASSIHTRTDSEQTSTKRPKNKQNRPALSSDDQEDNTSSDKYRKPAAKDITTPTPDGVPSSTCCAGFKGKNMSTSTYTGSAVSTSGQGRIKLEPPIIKTETTPAPTGTNVSIDHAEAPKPTEFAILNGPNLNHRTVTVRRKAANRTDPLYLPPPPSPQQNIAAPLSLSAPPAEETPAMKKPRVEDEATRKTFLLGISEGFPSPGHKALPITAAVSVSTRQQVHKPQGLAVVEADGDGHLEWIHVLGENFQELQRTQLHEPQGLAVVEADGDGHVEMVQAQVQDAHSQGLERVRRQQVHEPQGLAVVEADGDGLL